MNIPPPTNMGPYFYTYNESYNLFIPSCTINNRKCHAMYGTRKRGIYGYIRAILVGSVNINENK